MTKSGQGRGGKRFPEGRDFAGPETNRESPERRKNGGKKKDPSHQPQKKPIYFKETLK